MGETYISRITVVRCLGPRLVPFFKSFAILYVLFPKDESTLSYCFFKCAPILCLIGFVLMYGFRAPYKRAYSKKILLGLIFSCIGDAFLVWPSVFIPGVMFFTLAHVLYISAFGFYPLAPAPLPIIGVLITLVYNLVSPHLSTQFKVIGLLYGGILTMMVWRASADLLASGPRYLSWTSISRALGAFLFAISDSILCISLFHTGGMSLSSLILPTYYAAQMCIAVSVVDRQLNSLKAGSSQDQRETVIN